MGVNAVDAPFPRSPRERGFGLEIGLFGIEPKKTQLTVCNLPETQAG
jgi:hypothetical protein